MLKEVQRRGKGDNLEESEDEKSNMQHIKEIFKKYIRGFPLASKDHERLCHVLFSMMDMANELDEVNEARSKISFLAEEDPKKKAKKSLLGLFKKKEKN